MSSSTMADAAAPKDRKHVHRRSFSLRLLTAIPDFSSLVVRSNSTISRRRNPRGRSSGYADSSSFVDHQNMHTERPSRNIKKESKFYSFLTRSRSRSRTRDEPDPQSTTPKSRSRAPTIPNRRSVAPVVIPGSKPPTRVQSRPLSSTTTATLTPSTPKARRLPQSHREKPLPAPIPKAPGSSKIEPSTKPKKRFQDLFSISLASLARSPSRSHSRPGSPLTTSDVPPIPTTYMLDDDVTPKPRKSFSPHGPRRLANRSPSPTPGPKVLRVVNVTATTSSSNGSITPSIRITKLFTKNSAESKQPALPPLPVSQPLRRISSLRRRSSLKEDKNGSYTNLLGQVPPLKFRENPPLSSGKTRVGHAVKGSLDSGLRYRAASAVTPMMGAVDEEEARSDVASLNPKRGKSRERNASPPLPHLPKPPGPVKLSSSSRSTKHGSFDFERPGWNGVAPLMMQRSGSGGTAGSIPSGEGKEKDGSGGPGLAGVGTLQRDVSMRRMQEEQVNRDRMKGSTDKRKLVSDRDKDKTSSQRTTPDYLHASTSTTGTNGTGAGKNSSLSKATGKRFIRATGKTGSGTGLSRLISGHPQHGLFSFEPPVPTPTSWSTGTGGSTSTTGTGYLQIRKEEDRAKAEREFERVQREKERQKEMKKRGLKVTGDRPPVPVPKLPTQAGRLSNTVGHRSGQKGRSLDLGLGLAWAPSKVPEEALLHISGMNNGRSTENGNGSTSGHSRQSGRIGYEEGVQGSKLGREVAEYFRQSLDEDNYRLFKHYVHQFDAHEIPFDGPDGIVTLVERLLSMSAPDLAPPDKRRMLDRFVKIILQQAGNSSY